MFRRPSLNLHLPFPLGRNKFSTGRCFYRRCINFRYCQFIFLLRFSSSVMACSMRSASSPAIQRCTVPRRACRSSLCQHFRQSARGSAGLGSIGFILWRPTTLSGWRRVADLDDHLEHITFVRIQFVVCGQCRHDCGLACESHVYLLKCGGLDWI